MWRSIFLDNRAAVLAMVGFYVASRWLLGAEFYFDRVLIQPGQPLVFVPDSSDAGAAESDLNGCSVVRPNDTSPIAGLAWTCTLYRDSLDPFSMTATLGELTATAGF